MSLRWLLIVGLLAAPVSVLAQFPPGLLADQHLAKGLTCASCHKETPPKSAVPDQVCITCHGGVAAIVARTNDYDPNPHVSPHSAAPQCTTCHHAHKASEISCLACHPDKTFVKESDPP